MGRYKTVIRRAAIAGYAAYKWIESHADEVERWADKAAARSKGSKAEKVVVPSAQGLSKFARWIQDEKQKR